MPDKDILPIAPVRDLVRWWREERVQGLVIGGLAVALLGRPRVTRDIDALVLLPEDKWPAFLHAAGAHHLVPRDPDALVFAQEARVLLLRHVTSGIDVDLTLGNLPFEAEAVARAHVVRIARVLIPLPTPEDLIVMKAVAHRERDLQDIEGPMAAHPGLDRRRVRRWVKTFARTLGAPELYDDLQARFARRRGR